MSQVLVPQIEPSASPAPVPAPPEPRSSRTLIAWTIGASLLLIGSGVVRAVQSREYEQEASYLIECPFPLSTIPRTIGDWQVVQGSEIVLDPLTTRISGSTDHIMRTYVDELTGVRLAVLVLFGPAEPVLPHTPQVCYPATGYRPEGNTVDRDVRISPDETAKFRTSIFAKSGGRTLIRTLVYHSFWLKGPWTPAIANQKFPRKNPGIFKVQIHRQIGSGEKIEESEPIEGFVQQLLPVIEKMTADAVHQPATTTTPIAANRATTATAANGGRSAE